jgi:hypothetical protein
MIQEIRYRFVEAGSQTYAKLGESWESSLEYCLSGAEDSRKVRRRLSEDIKRYIKGFDTQLKRKELSLKLSRHLDELRRELELGEENSTYQRYDRIRKRLVLKYNLPYEDIPQVEPVETVDKELSERYMTLVRTALRNGKGQLTTAMLNMIKASQKRFGLTDVQAQRLIKLVEAEFNEPESLIEYREMFEAFYEDGEITDDERALLIERQVELGLTDEQVKEAEIIVTGKRKADAAG